MRLLVVSLLWLFLGSPALAEVLVADRTVRAGTLVTGDMLRLDPGDHAAALSDPTQAIGLEARITLYAGRPILPESLGPPTLVTRNQIAPLTFQRGGLTIATEVRALDAGGAGDVIRVMNLTSKTTLTATITATGALIVAPDL